MKKILAVTMASLVVLNACGSIDKEKLGLSRKAPNENLVSTRAPLSLPPEYNQSPAKLAQKRIFKAPSSVPTFVPTALSEPEKEPEVEAPRKYQTNAMRKTSLQTNALGMTNAEQAFVSQIRANQKAYQKQEAEEAVSLVKVTPKAPKDVPDALAKTETASEPDVSALAAEELKNHVAKENKPQLIVQPSNVATKTTEKPKKTSKAKVVTNKKYSAPQYSKKTTGKRSPLKPLPKTRAFSASDNISAGEKALINHFDNQAYISDTVN